MTVEGEEQRMEQLVKPFETKEVKHTVTGKIWNIILNPKYWLLLLFLSCQSCDLPLRLNSTTWQLTLCLSNVSTTATTALQSFISLSSSLHHPSLPLSWLCNLPLSPLALSLFLSPSRSLFLTLSLSLSHPLSLCPSLSLSHPLSLCPSLSLSHPLPVSPSLCLTLSLSPSLSLSLSHHLSLPLLSLSLSLSLSLAAVKGTPFLSAYVDVSFPPVLIWYGDTRRHNRMLSMFGQLRSARRGESLAPAPANEAGPGVT